MRLNKTSTEAFVPIVTSTFTTTSTVDDVVTELCIIRSDLPQPDSTIGSSPPPPDPRDTSTQYGYGGVRTRTLTSTASTETTITESWSSKHTHVTIETTLGNKEQTTRPEEDEVKELEPTFPNPRPSS